MTIKTASQLKTLVEGSNPSSKFFTRNNMKFAGDAMANYGVRSATITNLQGEKVEVWELYRRKPVKYGLQKSAYFNKQTFSQVFNHETI